MTDSVQDRRTIPVGFKVPHHSRSNLGQAGGAHRTSSSTSEEAEGPAQRKAGRGRRDGPDEAGWRRPATPSTPPPRVVWVHARASPVRWTQRSSKSFDLAAPLSALRPAIPAVTACHSRYSSPKACLLSSRMACASAPARPKGTAQAATSRMTPDFPPERWYLRLATPIATRMPAMTHSA